MGDALNKLIRLLDQLLPFLVSAPPWLRVWVYALIILNFVTIAVVSVSYLVSKQKREQASSFEHFTIESPAANDVIPLSETGKWMVAGNFPVIPTDQSVKHEVLVEVLRLPSREKVPQDGSATISTARGAWRFESAKFTSAGSYEIVATAVLGNASDFRSVQVSCTDKATAYRESTIKDAERRGAPPIAWPKAENVSLPQIEGQLGAFQNQFYQQYLAENNLTKSLETVNLALNVVDPLLPIFPNNYELQTFRAYMLKNYFMVMRDMGRPADANWFLEEATKMFDAIHEQNPNDASVLNGLGSVWGLRGNPQMALQYIDQALFLQPDYPEAVHDRELMLGLLKAQEKPVAH